MRLVRCRWFCRPNCCVFCRREFERIGGHQTIRVDIRIVAATNRCLQTMVKEGTFREDLFYRLNVIHLTLPPLRERRKTLLISEPLFTKI
jgi:transcriptional regulator with PAS, ATPase and Fis domain